MKHNKKITIGLIIVLVGIGLAFVVRDYVFFPGKLGPRFSLDAVDQGLAPFNEYAKGQVIEVLAEQTQDLGEGLRQRSQQLKIKLLSGERSNQEIEVVHQETPSGPESQKIVKGDTLVLGLVEQGDASEYVVIDRYRLPGVYTVLLVFAALVVVFARWRGVSSLVGLAFSIAVIAFFLVPNILNGRSPLLMALIAALVIAIVSIFLAHGLRKRTVVAVVSTVVTLGIAQGLAIIAVRALSLFGTGSPDALYLQQGLLSSIDLRGLLLAGVIIGALGVLDDVTTTQAASVEEISKADATLSVRELYKRGEVVGREHIAALVNTLVLAYAGVALPLFLLVLVNAGQPLWTLLNSEPMVEEIVRTLAGSTALVLGVPISTFLAAYVFGSKAEPPTKAELVVKEEIVIVK